MNKQLEQVKNQIERTSVIDYISFSEGSKPYVSFSDTDAMTDYSHGYSINQKDLITELQTKGADIIQVFTNYYHGEDNPDKILKTIKRIADKSGYISDVALTQIIEHGYKKQKIENYVIKGQFIRREV